ncbi:MULTISPECIES: 2-phosphosulfolactate phosphatase [unclassified Paenibacillus]|uniref:2-phosphosulfolactate phosphatase n=1 Tax=unclassified Paenibacillus TaxID=185978 RepID=UPI001AE900FC|nr:MULTISPECIES: 2-phosphosulfolactate phosphatase [unclassified Paenibacillus]MBP1155117.1 2-phosphosulfolactate phosphatase [Paenibacillus sp. PvP091]MBP1169499.1 2-phosphosulfolactate phosphatase [Paenibacillus sp. PvR098]MBP2440527.1 2-phosphosulfolactate phosphatase [Paenibacillus sp. PvP052]
MNVQVIASVGEARTDELQNKTVIVIDVLRATSTMVMALTNGSKSIVPTETVAQAKSLQRPGDLLGGERSCKKIPGFDFGNSPFEYSPEAVAGKTIVMTTTNGTRAVQKSHKAAHILAGSLLNASSCVEKALKLQKEIALLCAGTHDVFSLEDGLCAGLLADELVRLTGGACEVNDLGLALMHAYRQTQERLPEALLSCANGKRLTRIGFKDDVLYCSQVNRLQAVPQFRDGAMVI